MPRFLLFALGLLPLVGCVHAETTPPRHSTTVVTPAPEPTAPATSTTVVRP
jgi:hypothetical protein